MPQKPFKGIIKLDVRDSVADWAPYLPAKAPEGAPNILFVLFDDTGLAAWSPFGGGINMPTLQKLADSGLTVFAVAHDRAVLADALDPADRTQPSPERHGRITEGRTDSPARTAASRRSARRWRRFSRTNGWSTFWLGKNHNVPEQDIASGATRKQWPLQKGSTASTASSAARPTSGTRTWSMTTSSSTSHTARRRAITSPRIWPTRRSACSATRTPPIRRGRGTCGSARAPTTPRIKPAGVHRQVQGQVRRRLRGLSRVGAAADDREGHPAEGHAADAAQSAAGRCRQPGDMVRPWDTLNADEKKLFSRLMEVYAGFSEYTDAQVGRIIEYLEKTGQLENTVVIYAADNGASGEGSPNGSVNENKFFNGYPDSSRRT